MPISVPDGWSVRDFGVALKPGKPVGAMAWFDVQGRPVIRAGRAWKLAPRLQQSPDQQQQQQQQSQQDKPNKAKEETSNLQQSQQPSKRRQAIPEDNKPQEKSLGSSDTLFSAGKNVDIEKVEAKAAEWRKIAGLSAEPDTVDWKHDRVHALVHEFLGGYHKIGEWNGEGKVTPTPAEEILVNMIHRAASTKGSGGDPREKMSDYQLREYLRRDVGFMSSRGDINKKNIRLYHKFIKNEYGRDENEGIDFPRFIKKYREMESSPQFDNLLDAAHQSFTDAGALFS